MNIVYRVGLPRDMIDQAVRLYDDAFGEKYALAIPDPAVRKQLLSRAANHHHVIVALCDKRLVGLAGYQTMDGAFIGEFSRRNLTGALGTVRGWRAHFIFKLYQRRLSERTLMLDGLVVDSNLRGHGIGTALLNHLSKWGREQGYGSLVLDVVDTNVAARRLYDRAGFTVTRIHRYRLLAPVFGFNAVTHMERRIG